MRAQRFFLLEDSRRYATIHPVIQRLAKRLQLRQQVVATAFVYFKRFYAK